MSSFVTQQPDDFIKTLDMVAMVHRARRVRSSGGFDKRENTACNHALRFLMKWETGRPPDSWWHTRFSAPPEMIHPTSITPMRIILRILATIALACSLCACLFKEPVYTEGFVKIDPGLGGVWATQDKDGDLRKIEFAVCAPLDENRSILHALASGKEGAYYEVRMLKVRDHPLLQLRMLATFDEGLSKVDDERYAILRLEGDLKGSAIKVFALDDDRVEGKGPAEVKRLLESPSEDWKALFGEGMVYRRMKDA
jgi:hypothetical protein